MEKRPEGVSLEDAPAGSGFERKRNGTFTLCASMKCALRGIGLCFSDRNFRIELCFAACAVALGVALGISSVEWLAIVLCIFAVLSCETVNTALETLVDLVSPSYDELARNVKDAAAGAVLVLSIGSLVVAAIVYLPRLVALAGA